MKLAEFVEEVLLGKPNASDAGPEVRYRNVNMSFLKLI